MEAEYTMVPNHSIRRFACVAERADYNELPLDVPATSPWLISKRPDMDASSRNFYEPLELSVMASRGPSAAQHGLAARSIPSTSVPLQARANRCTSARSSTPSRPARATETLLRAAAYPRRRVLHPGLYRYQHRSDGSCRHRIHRQASTGLAQPNWHAGARAGHQG